MFVLLVKIFCFNLQLWRTEAEELVRKLCEQESASPFLEPVDTHTHKVCILRCRMPVTVKVYNQATSVKQIL